MMMMIMDPFRLYRRRQRIHREAMEEAGFLRRRYGDGALQAAREQLAREDLTTWGRRVMAETIRLLQRRS